ncbi:MAG TPA: NrdH-redoxin [Actinobacteria bacterium]|nr:NrdH-redoxin [Actinomycetota bacterium]
MEIKEVKVFTTPTCPFCVMAKDFLRTKGVDYVEKNVADDVDARQEMMELTGQAGVPVIFIDGDVVVGFNRTMLESLLTEN